MTRKKDALHSTLKSLHTYTNKMVNNKNVPDKLALTPEQVEYFVSIASQPNNTMRICDLEKGQEDYGILGEYWMVLAECYYSEGEYKKRLDAVNSGFALGYDIFKKDRRLSEVLPYAIISAGECYDGKQYADLAKNYADMIVSIRSQEKFDWSLCYFAAQMYVNLYAQTGDEDYLMTHMMSHVSL